MGAAPLDPNGVAPIAGFDANLFVFGIMLLLAGVSAGLAISNNNH